MVKKTITLRDIAEYLNVSRMTVSLALRDSTEVAPDTRKKVKAAAKKLGYKPNPKLARMMAELAQTRDANHNNGELVFITSHTSEDSWKDFYHIRTCFEGAKEQAEAFGYQLTPVWSLARRFSGNRLSDVLWSRGVEGIIVSPLGPGVLVDKTKKIQLDWARFPLVQIGATLTEPKMNIVRANHRNAMFQSLYALEGLGYQRIGLAISDVNNIRSYYLWMSAYLQWRSMRGMQSELKCLIYEDGKLSPQRLRKWMKVYKVDSIIGLGKEVLRILHRLKVKVPQEIGYSSLDIVPTEENHSGIYQNPKLIGATAVDNLVLSSRKGKLGPPSNPTQTLIDGRWVEGQSTQPMTTQPVIVREVYSEQISGEF